MPRYLRTATINALDLQAIERQADLLRSAIRKAQIGLEPFCEHYDAVSNLSRDLDRALNVLTGRQADYMRPMGGPD